MDRIKRLRWQQRSLPDDIKINLSPQEIQVLHPVTRAADYKCHACSPYVYTPHAYFHTAHHQCCVPAEIYVFLSVECLMRHGAAGQIILA